ncbi:hypothetical protein V5S96_10420 [Corynebacterium mastitidis]|uniref:Uncharacterized protein n=1 Tax=Corynebacterium mastitidis TaxID=161890 RepID=A0ABU8P0H6_9CORY
MKPLDSLLHDALDVTLGEDESQARRWHERRARAPRRLASWRTPARQRLLIAAYFSALTLGVATAVGCFFWKPLAFLWIPVTLVTSVCWFMMRATIDGKDVAPAAALDEYENQVLHRWRSLAYGLAVFLLLLLAFALIALAVGQPADLTRWIYSLGLLTILGYLAAVSLPVVGYSITFHSSDSKD